MADGRVKTWGGKILRDTGAVATADACCCEPCTNCGNPQPDALVTIAGGCNPLCLDAQGVYVFNNFTDFPAHCLWEWLLDASGTCGGWYILQVVYCKATSTWCANIVPGGPGVCLATFGRTINNCACQANMTDITGSVACSGGFLVGLFQLIGDLNMGVDCTACTATVTVGP